jgi:aryl sulfotransferase
MPALLRAPTRQYRTAVMDSARWDGYRPRQGDIIIATFAKVGTTWTQRIVDMLVFQSAEPRPVIALSPWLDATFFAPVEANLETLEGQTHRRFIKTHLPLDAVPLYDGVSYIHVGRDGRDACMSMHNHDMAFKPEMRARIASNASDERQKMSPPPADPREYYLEWIARNERWRDEPGADMPFFAFENTYWRERRRANVIFLHYNDMKQDLGGEMRRLSRFLGIDTPEPLMDELVRAATFETMKAQGSQIMPGAEVAFEGGAQRFFNKGVNARWKDILTGDDVARYERAAAAALSPACASWVASGRIAAGEPRDLPD